ncbi:MAG: MgtC/SapB family protein [Xanthomonadaceae bacterium]|nr:MgtC/SapB family protein [Xanthomonadaceae bacterium]
METTLSFIQLVEFFLPKLGFAVVCGGVLGLEREMKMKPAGIKTNILICVGSMLFTGASVLISSTNAASGHYGDAGRLAAQVVSGIGFLGGGVIMQSRGTVVGLTTAATMWVVSALGICVGLGHGWIAVAIAVGVVLMLIVTTFFEHQVFQRQQSFECEVSAHDPRGEFKDKVSQYLAANDLSIEDYDLAKDGDIKRLRVKCHGRSKDYRKFILDLWELESIEEVKQR